MMTLLLPPAMQWMLGVATKEEIGELEPVDELNDEGELSAATS